MLLALGPLSHLTSVWPALNIWKCHLACRYYQRVGPLTLPEPRAAQLLLSHLCTCLGCTYLWFLIWADLLWRISCPDKLRLRCKPRWIWQSWPVNILVDFALVTYDCLKITDRNNDSMYFKEEKSLGKIANDTFKYLTGPKSSSCLIWKHTESIIAL